MLGLPAAKDVICVHFDFAAELCKLKAAKRWDHPTIRAGGGARIIEEQAKVFEKPTTAEGFGLVEVVENYDQAAVLLRRFGAEGADAYAGMAFVAGSAAAASARTADDNTGGYPSQVVPSESGATPALLQSSAALAEPEPTQTQLTNAIPGLHPDFCEWLHLAMEEEMPAEDLDSIWDCVAVILQGAADDPEALGSAADVLNDNGAPSSAERLEAKWQSMCV